MAIQWDPSYETFVEEVDGQHHDLLNHINGFLAACRDRKGRDGLGKLLSFLARHTERHFQAEEGLMRRYSYPAALTHAMKHSQFLAEVQGLLNRLTDEGPGLLIVLEAGRVIEAWWETHLKGEDRALAAFLRDRRWNQDGWLKGVEKVPVNETATRRGRGRKG